MSHDFGFDPVQRRGCQLFRGITAISFVLKPARTRRVFALTLVLLTVLAVGEWILKLTATARLV